MTVDSKTDSKPRPPKRNLKKVGTVAGIKKVPAVTDAVNKAVLTICRLNILSACPRTRIETLRIDSLNNSNNREYNFAEDIYTATALKEAAFLVYMSYWLGQLRTLRRAWEKKQEFDKQAWGKFTKVVKLVEAVAISGFDAIDMRFSDEKQKYFIAKRR